MSGLLGKKLQMTQIFDEEGSVIPVTLIKAGPCTILQIKTLEKDGYCAIQLAFEDIKETKLRKSLQGRFKKLNTTAKRFIREVRTDQPQDYKLGQQVDVTQFKSGDFVDIVGTSIGRGFQGGIKRWHWSRGPESHGSMSHRAPGSIGASAFPSRVVKGHHLPGHMGNQRTTVQNLEIIKVDKDNDFLLVKGSIPGYKNSFLIIKEAKKKKAKAATKKPEKAQVKPEKQEKQGAYKKGKK